MYRHLSSALALFSTLLAGTVRADEGMWLFTDPPRKQLKEKYNFEPSQQWLEHLQKSSVRFNNGGSGSFVSADGLVMTNHHVAADCLHKLSTAGNNIVRDGFLARTREAERACVDLELNVLMSIEDVTTRVNDAVSPALDSASAQKARTAVINNIEQESLKSTGLRSDVVSLFNGGTYHLYRYKRYTDVRLVFAPESSIAFFGGDPDNFEYPRYNFDVAFFRVYENGKPARLEHYLKWSAGGASEDELIFVSGHPGRTDRLNTVAHLEFLRDREMPRRLDVTRRREVVLSVYASRGAENARRAHDDLVSLQNSRKARGGMLEGLQDPALMAEKRRQESALREAVAKSAQMKEQFGDAWEQVAAALQAWDEIWTDHYLLERAQGFSSQLFFIAFDLVRLAQESAKPNAERLREYSEAGLDSLKLRLFSEAPIYEDLEIAKLADSLAMFTEWMGGDHALVRQVLAGKPPRERASELIRGTKLKSVDFRRKLADGGLEAVKASDDPMIRLALLVEGPARKLRTVYDQKVEEPLKQAYGKIAQARFQLYGKDTYPDATFTLRLAYGQVKGYVENGEKVPSHTTLGGTYKHAADHGSREPWELPKSWLTAKDRLKLETPYNFVSTADITGGNSGSPVVNRAGEVVGIVFDGNVYSLVLSYMYTDEQARAISVHSAGILEALRKVYGADDLVKELTARS